ncbi:MAG: CotH kinase family protein [Bacteroidales bacterium]|nr:CotH kinase family protein [Bacteroidales bacterium]
MNDLHRKLNLLFLTFSTARNPLVYSLLIAGLISFFYSFTATAQPNFPEDGEVYRDDVVPRVDIFIHPDTLQWIYNNVSSNIEWRANFIFNNGTITDTIEEVGFRLRGNTSRQSAKKSFKVSFNTYQKGRKYYGLEKINLNGEHNDPSVTRAKLFWDLCREFGIPAPRSNHVRVYINNNYYGLYLNVEHIDEEFAGSRFGNQYGNLYKCLYPADLKYLGSNPNAYKLQMGDRRVYDLKTNTAYDDYSDIAHFIHVLNNTPIASLACELENVFNVQDYLRIMAIDVFTGDWDGYIFNKNNFYLYQNPVSGKFEYIPYDVDNTFGIDWFGVDWGTRNIYQWAPSNQQNEPRPLYNRLMEVPRYRDLYSYYLNQIIQELIVQPGYFAYIESIRDKIYPYIIDDPYYPLDYGFNAGAFLQSFESDWGAHVKYGIKPYITTRLNSIQQQLELNSIYPVINYLSVNHTGVGNPVNFKVNIWDDQPGLSVFLRYRFNDSGFVTMPMEPGQDGWYQATLNGVIGETTLRYHLQVQDASNNTLFYPCETVELYFPPIYSSGLFINEFMASNLTTIYDANGDFDDWIEIYNGGSDPVWLGDKYLSDNLNNPAKWQFPDHVIFPGEYLIIWADDDAEQGPFHTTYKLSAEGESIGIFNSTAAGQAPIDTYTFGAQQDDISLGRSPDGSSNWVYFTEPTPGATNEFSVVVDSLNPSSGLKVYPNPVTDNDLFFSRKVSFTIFRVSGEKVLEADQVLKIDISRIPKGVYLLKTNHNETVKIIVL